VTVNIVKNIIFVGRTTSMEDNYRHQGLRRILVENLSEKGIENEKILLAIATLPRHFFLDKAFEEWAYHDKAFPIGNEQTISQPYTVARQTELLDVQVGEKILEIGTGSGYQAAILAILGAKVFSIERQEKLYEKAKKLLAAMQLPSLRLFFGDGYEGLPRHAPFDKILFTAGAERVPLPLLQQLKINGKIVVPLGNGDTQIMHVITKIDAVTFEKRAFEACAFVPFLQGVVKGK
jgi:protein-L-isoaspartate(D-aspartate) O-methyltransferase